MSSPPTASTSPLTARPRYLLLGPPAFRHGDALVQCTGRRQTLLLCLLALSARTPVEVGRLFDALWPNALPQDPNNALQSQVSRLRRLLAGASIRQVGGGYMLDEPPAAVDSHQLEQLVGEARRLLAAGAYALARIRCSEGIELWRGEPMAALQDDLEVRRAALRICELRLDAGIVRVQAEMALGLHAQTVPTLRSMVNQHPLREDVWALLVTALYRSGRSAEALAALRRARSLLVRELGLEPGPGLRELERGILGQAAALAGPPHPCAAHARVLVGPGGGSAGLDLPPAVGPFGASADWAEYPATRVFLDRLRTVHPQADPGPREAAQIVSVCHLLDGDPLAIELAAASLATTGMDGLGTLLDRHLRSRMLRSSTAPMAVAAETG